MKITKLNVENFGKLKNKELDLAPHISIITGANESGKSTVSRFLRFMLYGFTSQRSSEISKNDKKKYTSWDSPSTRGEMTVISGDETFTVRREQQSRASHSITNSDGVPVFAGIDAGEAFLGVDAETFDKTALISAGDVFFENAVSLSTSIKNMVFSADSAIDSEVALKKLDDFRRSILGKTEKSGRLFDARCELAELIAKRAELADIHKELLAAEASLSKTQNKIAENKKSIERLEKERDNINAKAALDNYEKLERVKNTCKSNQEEYENHRLSMSHLGFIPDREFLSQMNEALLNLSRHETEKKSAENEVASAKNMLASCYSNKKQFKFNSILKTLDTNADKLSEDLYLMKTELKSLKKKQKICFCLFFLIIPLVCAFVFGAKAKKIKNALERLALQFECVDIVEFEYLLSNSKDSEMSAKSAQEISDNAGIALDKAREALAKTANELSDMLEKSGCATAISDISDIGSVAKEHIKKLQVNIEKSETLFGVYQNSSVAYNALLNSFGDIEELKRIASTYNAEIPLRDKTKNAVELDFYTRANEGLAIQERDYEKRTAVITSNMTKPDELTSKINLLSDEIKQLEKQHAAAVMAHNAISSAHMSIRENVSPILTKEASEFFHEMTGGKYTGLYVDKDLNLTFLEKGSAEYRSVDYLSSGAIDAAYLSLRITLAKYLYKDEPVFIFDDAFTRFDDERLGKICKIIEKLSEKYQVIILTCHSREQKLLTNAKIINI